MISANIDRRSFVIGAATVGGGLALGLKLPFGTSVVPIPSNGADELDNPLSMIMRNRTGSVTIQRNS